MITLRGRVAPVLDQKFVRCHIIRSFVMLAEHVHFDWNLKRQVIEYLRHVSLAVDKHLLDVCLRLAASGKNRDR